MTRQHPIKILSLMYSGVWLLIIPLVRGIASLDSPQAFRGYRNRVHFLRINEDRLWCWQSYRRNPRYAFGFFFELFGKCLSVIGLVYLIDVQVPIDEF